MEIPNAVTSALSAPSAPLICWGARGLQCGVRAMPLLMQRPCSVAVLHLDDFTRPTPEQRLVAGDLPPLQRHHKLGYAAQMTVYE